MTIGHNILVMLMCICGRSRPSQQLKKRRKSLHYTKVNHEEDIEMWDESFEYNARVAKFVYNT